MSALEIKQEIQEMIIHEDNISTLEAVRELLIHHKEETDPLMAEKMIASALRAEEDIKAGRVYTEEEFYKKSDELLGE